MHFPRRSDLPVWAFLVAALVASPAVSGTLNDFETDAAGREENKSKKEKEKTDSADGGDMCLDAVGEEICASLCASSLIEDFIKNAGRAISRGGSNSLDRIDPGGLAAQKDPGIVRKRGEALTPFLRVDAAYQEVESDVTAWDYRFELGYGSLGFQFRYTAYSEKEPPDALRVSEYHVLYRMSATPRFEVDLGAGAMILNGFQNNTGYSVTVPILYHPTDFYGFEFRPVWSSINENDIQDFDLVNGGIYTPDASARTYQRLRDLADGLLAAGHSVLVDATFVKRSHRQPFRELAARHGVPFILLDCTADLDTLRARVAARRARGDDAAEADVEVLERQLRYDEPPGADENPLKANGDGDLERLRAAIGAAM